MGTLPRKRRQVTHKLSIAIGIIAIGMSVVSLSVSLSSLALVKETASNLRVHSHPTHNQKRLQLNSSSNIVVGSITARKVIIGNASGTHWDLTPDFIYQNVSDKLSVSLGQRGIVLGENDVNINAGPDSAHFSLGVFGTSNSISMKVPRKGKCELVVFSADAVATLMTHDKMARLQLQSGETGTRVDLRASSRRSGPPQHFVRVLDKFGAPVVKNVLK